MASFPAKTGWDKPKKGENKNYRSDQFLPNPLENSKKIAKIFKKLKKYHYGFFSSQNRLGQAKKGRK